MSSRLPDMTTKYEWRDCYSVGNAIIDRQHKQMLLLCAESAKCLESAGVDEAQAWVAGRTEGEQAVVPVMYRKNCFRCEGAHGVGRMGWNNPYVNVVAYPMESDDFGFCIRFCRYKNPLRQLEIFSAVAKTKNVFRAADRLMISQSAAAGKGAGILDLAPRRLERPALIIRPNRGARTHSLSARYKP